AVRVTRLGDFFAGAVRTGAFLRRLGALAYRVPTKGATSGVVRQHRRGLVPRAGSDVRQGRADHVDAARPVSAARDPRARDAAGQRGTVRVGERAADVRRGSQIGRAHV